MKPTRVLVIAGSDSSGGAGIQADIKTITMLGGYAMTAITALTAQNTLGVAQVLSIPAGFVIAQIDACLADIGADAVKIGMIGSAAVAVAVAARLQSLDQHIPIVFDPVMVATSGGVLADGPTIAAFASLMAIATVTTPNIPELAALGGVEALVSAGVTVLAKGGDAHGAVISDTLHRPGEAPRTWSAPRIETRHTHGTGCTLASALAASLGSGMSLPDAVERARAYVRGALLAAPGFGAGSGPLGHAAAADPAKLNRS